MIHSKRSHEGYLKIDHRTSPGLRTAPIGIVVPEGAVLEAPTVTCSHCERIVVLNPARVRPRPWCAKCDHYICDGCDEMLRITGECLPMRKRFDQLEQAARAAGAD